MIASQNGQEAASLSPEERISVRAYYKWHTRRRAEDSSLRDWLEAEAELAAGEDLTRRVAEWQSRLTCILAESGRASRLNHGPGAFSL